MPAAGAVLSFVCISLNPTFPESVRIRVSLVPQSIQTHPIFLSHPISDQTHKNHKKYDEQIMNIMNIFSKHKNPFLSFLFSDQTKEYHKNHELLMNIMNTIIPATQKPQ